MAALAPVANNTSEILVIQVYITIKGPFKCPAPHPAVHSRSCAMKDTHRKISVEKKTILFRREVFFLVVCGILPCDIGWRGVHGG